MKTKISKYNLTAMISLMCYAVPGHSTLSEPLDLGNADDSKVELIEELIEKGIVLVDSETGELIINPDFRETDDDDFKREDGIELTGGGGQCF